MNDYFSLIFTSLSFIVVDTYYHSVLAVWPFYRIFYCLCAYLVEIEFLYTWCTKNMRSLRANCIQKFLIEIFLEIYMSFYCFIS